MGATRATIGTVHSLLALLQPHVFNGPQPGKANQRFAAIAAVGALCLLLQHLKHGPATRCLHYPLLVGLGIVAALATIGQAERHGFLGSVIGTNLDPSQALEPKRRVKIRAVSQVPLIKNIDIITTLYLKSTSSVSSDN